MPSARYRAVLERVPAKLRRTFRARSLRSVEHDSRRSPETARALNAAAGRHSDSASLFEALRTGGSLTDAIISEVEMLLSEERIDEAASIAGSLKSEQHLVETACLASALVAYKRSCFELAWHEFTNTPLELWSRHAPAAYVQTGLHFARKQTLDEVRDLLSSRPDELTARAWSGILGPVYGAGDYQLAREIFSVYDRLVGKSGKQSRLAVNRDWMQRWVHRSDDSPTVPAPPESDVSFAVMGYGHPGRSRASANIGDHVQTLASLGHLVRHQDLTYEGPQDLVDLMVQLRGRVRPERQLEGVSRRVNLLTIDRDATPYNEIPEQTWTIAFGWYMHAIFGMRYGFPFHRNLLPIFVSFHCNKRELLTEEAIEYLREHGPIGCRDFTTVDILLSLDVPAFFSGCLTTTVDTLFPELVGHRASQLPIAYIDVPDDEVPLDGVVYKHSADSVRLNSFTTNMYDAVERLETYRRKHSAAVTSRLHAYLPLRSVGVPVDFEPANRADVRFAGLIDISDAEFDRIRAGMNERLERVVRLVLSGAHPEAVYEAWGEMNRPDVESARARFARPGSVAQPAPDMDREIERAMESTRTAVGRDAVASADEVHIAIRLRRSRPQRLNVLLESLVRTTTRSLHVWLLAGTESVVDVDQLASTFPQARFSSVVTGGVGADLRDAQGGKVDRLDVLLLPRLLPHVDRVVLLPLECVVEDDIGELYDLDLHDAPLGAPRETRFGSTSGFRVVHAAASRLGSRTASAAELRRRAHARHVFDFDAFMVEVAVLDLDRFRGERLVDDAPGLIEEFGLDARETLHFVVGPRHVEIPDRWHYVPTRLYVEEPALVNWVDTVKPWQTGYVAEQDRWLRWRAEFRARIRAD